MNKGAFDEIKLRFSKKDMSFIPKDGKKRRRLLLILAAVIVGAYIVFSSVYMVNDQEKAVITTFGQVTGTAEEGMHFKLPFGIQDVHIVEVNAIKRIEIGYRSDGNEGEDITVANESKMITGDFNIVNIDFFIEYRITDPEKYLFACEDP